jgi:hypothetical protein
MAYTVRRRLTPGRRRWLESLLAGPKNRPRGTVGYHCMGFGWTAWERDAAGNYAEGSREVITDLGREALRVLSSPPDSAPQTSGNQTP